MAQDTNATPTQRGISRLNGAIDKIVVSDITSAAPTGPWSDAPVVRRAAAAGYLADLKNQDGGDILIFGGRTLWNALLTDGLVDELHLMIGPVALGAGTALFIGQPEVSLGLIDGPPMWNG